MRERATIPSNLESDAAVLVDSTRAKGGLARGGFGRAGLRRVGTQRERAPPSTRRSLWVAGPSHITTRSGRTMAAQPGGAADTNVSSTSSQKETPLPWCPAAFGRTWRKRPPRASQAWRVAMARGAAGSTPKPTSVGDTPSTSSLGLSFPS